MPSHEINKDRRRRSILDAARALIAESDDGDFSMPELAKRAGLSVATPYNLIGSKSDIIIALHDQELQRFRRQVTRIRSSPPVAALLSAADTALKIYLTDEKYFKVLIRVSLTAIGPVQEYFTSARERFWEGFLASVVTAGCLRPGLTEQAAAHFLANIYWAGIRSWAIDRIPSSQVRKQMAHTFALAIVAIGGEDWEREALKIAIRNQPSDGSVRPRQKAEAAPSA
ncbi:hypothetical protein sos41_40340 [Alphaproteobacteria bacterium SO-S41]|nr:hypothetical protein sos41_40340 [Alphaproteobacteria bacterium SO-S41]